MRFNDEQHINDFKAHGTYPRIHDDIYTLDKHIPASHVLDIGCSIGLLTARLAEKHDIVVGIDSDIKAVQKAREIRKPNVTLYGCKINNETIDEIERILKDHNINVIYARRVLPELTDAGGLSLIEKLVTMFYTQKVKYVVLEGRQRRRNAMHVMKDIDKEVSRFMGLYKPIEKFKECVLLERID